MGNRTTVKIGPAIDAKLYKEFVAVAKENGQSQRFLLEKAIAHYIHSAVPSQRTVRPEVMEALAKFCRYITSKSTPTEVSREFQIQGYLSPLFSVRKSDTTTRSPRKPRR